MKRLTVLLMLVVACGGSEDVTIGDVDRDWTKIGTGIWYGEFVTPDGRTIPCLRSESISRGGLSCDWGDR